MYKDYLNYVCCPGCKSDLIEEGDLLICKNCNKKYQLDNNMLRFDNDLSEDLKLSIEKWDERYKKQIDGDLFLKEFEEYKKRYIENTVDQIMRGVTKENSNAYLEIGCGPFFNGVRLYKNFEVIIGIDLCPHALIIAKKIFEKYNIENYILIQGDILNMPLKTNKIDLIYGGGVIEHFKDTQKCVNELYRCLKHGGASFNTVPYLNLGSLTYRQVWGNIPNLPVVRQLAELIHIKLLGGKHMVFGYEFSFTSGKIKKIHKLAGFKKENITVEKFDVDLIFEFLPGFLRGYAVFLAKRSFLFWPMIKVIAKK